MFISFYLKTYYLLSNGDILMPTYFGTTQGKALGASFSSYAREGTFEIKDFKATATCTDEASPKILKYCFWSYLN